MQLNFNWSAKQSENYESLWKYFYNIELFIILFRFSVCDWFLVFLASLIDY